MTTKMIATAADEGWAMRYGVRGILYLPKSGSTNVENEDAIGIDEDLARFAIADGATEAFDARGWACLLASRWADIDAATLRTPAEFLDWVEERGADWASDWHSRQLPWYAEEKRRAGSFAAFVGVEFAEEDGAWTWRATAIGDACLLRVRDGVLVEALPLDDYKAFNSTPRLVPSIGVCERLTIADVCVAHGRAEQGDEFWLMSDALAAWCLRSLAEEPTRFRELEEMVVTRAGLDVLAPFVEEERRTGRLRDDDMALIIVGKTDEPSVALELRRRFVIG